MKYLVLILLATCGHSQDSNIVGGGCDGCELMYIGMPETIPSISKSPAWESAETKLLITGKIFQTDGKTPAKNIIVYYWQTGSDGYYSSIENMDIRARKHGYIRGWVKSDSDGNYSIYTVKPKAYPGRDIPAHIHLSIKEPTIEDEYYVDQLVFNYDPLLTTQKRKQFKNRGGSGLLRTLVSDKMLIAEHNIILGLNIPNYPKSKVKVKPINSGQEIGEDFHSITPYHAWGPDRNTNTCPVCRYGRYLGIMYFVSEIKSQEVRDWLVFLEQQSLLYEQHLKVYLIYANEEDYDFKQSYEELSKLGQQLNLKRLALTFVPSFVDKSSDIYLSKINAKVDNTFILYKNRNIIGKFINLKANEDNYSTLKHVLKNNRGKFFKLPLDTKR